MNEKEYRAYPAMNQSVLKKGLKSAKALYHAMTTKSKTTPAMAFGSAYHARILEPETFGERYAVYEGKRDKRAKKYQAFLEENEGKTILSPAEVAQIEAMEQALSDHDVACGVIDRSEEVEKPIVWTDEATGVKCKALLDMVCLEHGYIGDLKTCQNVAPFNMARSVFDFGYHIQAAFYIRAFRACYPYADEPIFYFVCQEKEDPHDVGVYELDEKSLAYGDDKVGDLLALYKSCSDMGIWPGVCSDIGVLSLPRYAYKEE